MRLTQFSDYALRLLLYAAAHPERLVTIEETATNYRISRAHLMKVANHLVRSGFLHAERGRTGGLRLARAPATINVGDVVRTTEPDFQLVECFGDENACPISAQCRLRRAVHQALEAFIATLDGYTLADIALSKGDFPRLT